MKIPDSLKRYGLAKVYDYLDKDPMNNMGKVMDLVNKFAGDTLSLQREAFDKVINDKDSCWHQLRLTVVEDAGELLCDCLVGIGIQVPICPKRGLYLLMPEPFLEEQWAFSHVDEK